MHTKLANASTVVHIIIIADKIPQQKKKRRGCGVECYLLFAIAVIARTAAAPFRTNDKDRLDVVRLCCCLYWHFLYVYLLSFLFYSETTITAACVQRVRVCVMSMCMYE